MNLRSAYTAVLLPLPPAAVGVVGIVAAFLGAGVPAVRLHGVGASALGVADGMLWGTITASVAVALWAIAYAAGVRLFAVRLRGRRQAALAVLASGLAGWVAVALGAWGGAVVAGVPPLEAGPALARVWPQGGPVLAVALLASSLLFRSAPRDDA